MNKNKLFAGLTLIGIGIVYLGLRAPRYNWVFMLAGGIIALIGGASLWIINKKQDEKSEINYLTWKNNLFRNGIPIEVDLGKVEIKSNQYRQEVETAYSRSEYAGYDVMVGRDPREFESVNRSILVYQTEVDGQKRIFYSPEIDKDPVTLEFMLASKKSTRIYMDRENPGDYFFDVTFLYKQ